MPSLSEIMSGNTTENPTPATAPTPTDTPAQVEEKPPMSKEEWAQKQADKRTALYELRDEIARESFVSPASLTAALRAIALHDRLSCMNALLVLKQAPNATMVRNFEAWSNAHDRSVTRGTKGIQILERIEYTRKDGSSGYGFDIAHVFDYSGTHGEALAPQGDMPNVQDLTQSLLAANELAYIHSPTDTSIVVDIDARTVTAPDLDASAPGTFYALSSAIIAAKNPTFLPCECAAAAMVACHRYGLDPKAEGGLSELFEGGQLLEASEQAQSLSKIGNAGKAQTRLIERTMGRTIPQPEQPAMNKAKAKDNGREGGR